MHGPLPFGLELQIELYGELYGGTILAYTQGTEEHSRAEQ